VPRGIKKGEPKGKKGRRGDHFSLPKKREKGGEGVSILQENREIKGGDGEKEIGYFIWKKRKKESLIIYLFDVKIK